MWLTIATAKKRTRVDKGCKFIYNAALRSRCFQYVEKLIETQVYPYPPSHPLPTGKLICFPIIRDLVCLCSGKSDRFPMMTANPGHREAGRHSSGPRVQRRKLDSHIGCTKRNLFPITKKDAAQRHRQKRRLYFWRLHYQFDENSLVEQTVDFYFAIWHFFNTWSPLGQE